MQNIERLIWPDNAKFLDHNSDQWVFIVKYLLNSFESFIQWPLICEDNIEENVGQGFSIDICSAEPMPSPLELSFKGILGGDLIDEPKRLHISVCLFLYSTYRKLATKQNDSYVYFTFERNAQDTGIWMSHGWKQDVYDEYVFFDNWSRTKLIS